MRGRYPDYDVLATTTHWDAKTRGVVLDRVANVPPIRFFTETGGADAESVLRRRDRPGLQSRASRCSRWSTRSSTPGSLDGFRHHDMPADPETWRQVAANLDESAREHGCERGVRRRQLRELQHEIVAAVLRRRARLGAARHEGVGGGDARRARRVLLPPLGVERDRVRRPRLPTRVRAARRRAARALGGAPRVRGRGGWARSDVRERGLE